MHRLGASPHLAEVGDPDEDLEGVEGRERVVVGALKPHERDDEEEHSHDGRVDERVRELLEESVVNRNPLAVVIADLVKRLRNRERERRLNPDAFELLQPALDLVHRHDFRENLCLEQVFEVEAASTLGLGQLDKRLQEPDALERAEKGRGAVWLE